MKKSPIPVYLNRPILILAFESDTFIVAYMLTMCCFILGGWFFVVSLSASWGYAKAKSRFPRGFVIHGPYFLGLLRFRGYPTFFQKHFVN